MKIQFLRTRYWHLWFSCSSFVHTKCSRCLGKTKTTKKVQVIFRCYDRIIIKPNKLQASAALYYENTDLHIWLMAHDMTHWLIWLIKQFDWKTLAQNRSFCIFKTLPFGYNVSKLTQQIEIFKSFSLINRRTFSVKYFCANRRKTILASNSLWRNICS